MARARDSLPDLLSDVFAMLRFLPRRVFVFFMGRSKNKLLILQCRF